MLVGNSGWLARPTFDALDTLGIRNRVIFTGYLPDQLLPDAYSGALAFAYPSWYEGFGFPVLEAMACGTPVVCANTSSLPEITGDFAWLVSPSNPEALAAALGHVIDTPGIATTKRERGIANALTFTWARTAADTVAAYRDTVC